MNGIEWLKGRRCGISGAMGYIGSRLVQMLDEAGALPRDQDHSVEIIFHLSCQTSAAVADEDMLEDWAASVAPLVALLEEWKDDSTRPFIVLAGAATQAGLSAVPLIDGTERDAPITVYDLHKCMAEQYLEHAVRRGWARGTTLRLANVYGPSPAESSKTDRGVLNQWIKKAACGETIEVWGSGEWLRDYVYIDDVCRAFMLAAAHQETTNGRHFVIGSGVGHSVRAVAVALAARGNVEHVAPPSPLGPLDTRNAVMDTTAFRDATGWEPAISITDGIERTRAHYLEKQ